MGAFDTLGMFLRDGESGSVTEATDPPCWCCLEPVQERAERVVRITCVTCDGRRTDPLTVDLLPRGDSAVDIRPLAQVADLHDVRPVLRHERGPACCHAHRHGGIAEAGHLDRLIRGAAQQRPVAHRRHDGLRPALVGELQRHIARDDALREVVLPLHEEELLRVGVRGEQHEMAVGTERDVGARAAVLLHLRPLLVGECPLLEGDRLELSGVHLVLEGVGDGLHVREDRVVGQRVQMVVLTHRYLLGICWYCMVPRRHRKGPELPPIQSANAQRFPNRTRSNRPGTVPPPTQ